MGLSKRNRIRLWGAVGATASVVGLIALFLVLVLVYSLNWWLGLWLTIGAISYKAREEALNRIASEVLEP